MSTRFEQALARLDRLVAEFTSSSEARLSIALIGGLALGVWGVVRATEDVDLLVDSGDRRGLDEWLSFLASRKIECRLITSSQDDPLPMLVEIQPQAGLPVLAHLIVATRKWEAEMVQEAVSIDLGSGFAIPVVKPEHLLLLKLSAGGPQDLLDARKLLERMQAEAHINHAKLAKLASAMGIRGRLEKLFPKK